MARLYHPDLHRWKTVPDSVVASEQAVGWQTEEDTDVVAPDDQGRFPCPDCNKSFDSAQQLGGHRTVHRIDDSEEE